MRCKINNSFYLRSRFTSFLVGVRVSGTGKHYIGRLFPVPFSLYLTYFYDEKIYHLLIISFPEFIRQSFVKSYIVSLRIL